MMTATATNKEHLFGKLRDARNSVFILRLRGTKSEASSKGGKKMFFGNAVKMMSIENK